MFTKKKKKQPNTADRNVVIDFLNNNGLRGRRKRNSIPFFLVLGPPSCGKSDFLKGAAPEAKTIVTAAGAIWRVGDEAVYIEAPLKNSKTLQNLFEFLCLLRPDLPINAVLLALSSGELIMANNDAQNRVEQLAANSLLMLNQITNSSVPVYLLFTKADLIRGFLECFESCQSQERDQPLGFLLPELFAKPNQSNAALRHEIEKGLQNMVANLRNRQIDLLSHEPDPIRCGRINGFSTQIAILKTEMGSLFTRLIPAKPSRRGKIILRGFFFTSAYQNRGSIDAISQTLSQRFAILPVDNSQPSNKINDVRQYYFTKSLFKNVFLPESGLVKRSGWRNSLHYIYAFILLIFIISFASILFFIHWQFGNEIRVAGDISNRILQIDTTNNPTTITDFPNYLKNLRTLDSIALDINSKDSKLRLSIAKDFGGQITNITTELRTHALVVYLSACLERDIVDIQANISVLESRIMLARHEVQIGSAPFMQWLATTTSNLSPEDRKTIMDEAVPAIHKAGGLQIDPAYIKAANEIISYKESLK